MMWEKVRLENLCTIVRGSSPRPQGDARYYGGNIPRLMIEDLTRDGKYVTPQVDSLTEEGAKLSRPMKKGDLVITVSGRTGVPAILAVDACIHDGFVGFRDLLDKINIDYLFHYLSSLIAITSQQAVGAIFKNLTTDQLKNLEIPLPPLPIQKRIAEILDTADALRRKDEALLKKYDELAQAIFIDMFGDPVKNEKGWSVKKLGDLTNISSGSTPDRKKPEYYLGSIPWVKTTEVRGEIINKTNEYISKNALKNSSCKLHPKGSVIVAMYGQGKTRGQVGLLGIDATTNQACGVIKPNNSFNSIFLFNYLKNSYNELRKLGRGGNQENLNAGMLKDFEIMYPPLEIQTRFESIITLFNTQISLINGEKSTNLFNSLLQKAFNGELVS